MSSIQLSSIGDNATPHNVFASSTGGRINELSFSEGETKRKKEAGIKINRTKKRNEKGKLKVPIKNEQPSHPVFSNGHAIIHGYINRVLLKKWPVSLPLHPPRSLYCPFCLLPSPSPPSFTLSLFLSFRSSFSKWSIEGRRVLQHGFPAYCVVITNRSPHRWCMYSVYHLV